MSINEDLKKLYKENLSIIKKLSSELKDDFDGPLLMYCWDENFNDANYKILFIGQEHTNTCWFANDDIEDPLKWYETFCLAKNYNSTFWLAVKQINRTLNGNGSHKPNFLWTNVSKYATATGRPVGFEKHNQITNQFGFNILAKEIEIIKPDAIIFLSGNNYDEWIKIQFNNTISFDKKINDDIPVEDLSIVKLTSGKPILPIHSYRTHHPTPLSTQKKWYLLNVISLSIMGVDFYEILKKLNTDFNKLQNVKNENINIGNDFGNKEWTLKLEISEWKNFGIGFQFEENGFCSFFYGIFNDKNIQNKNTMDQINTIHENGERFSDLWPYWNWYEQKSWNKKTFEEIQNGEFIIKIQQIINDIIEKTKHLDM